MSEGTAERDETVWQGGEMHRLRRGEEARGPRGRSAAGSTSRRAPCEEGTNLQTCGL